MSGAAPPARTVPDALWTTTTYLGEGLPWSVLHQMTTEYFTAKKVSRAQVGYTSALHLAVTLKFLWSPFVDLFSTKRRWLIAMQLVLGALLLLVAFVAEAQSYGLLWVVLSLFAVLHATHDVACDGFYLLALDAPRQALYSGVRVAAFRAAMILGGGGLVYLAGRSSWLQAYALAGVIMLLLSGINAAWAPRPLDPRVWTVPRPLGDGPAGLWQRIKESAFFEAYRSFFTQPKAAAVLGFIFFFRLGDILMFAMAKPLLRDLGLDTATRGVFTGLGTSMTIVGSLLGGALISRHGLERWLVPMAFLQNGAIPLYILLARGGLDLTGIALVVLLEQFAAGVGNAAHTVFLMQRCRAAFSASHYAFATAVVALASTLAGVASGHLNTWLGSPRYFTFAFVCSWPSLVLVFFVPRTGVSDSARPPASAPASDGGSSSAGPGPGQRDR
jgi:PAT family beta-lactamase induction signal transducer AmpG